MNLHRVQKKGEESSSQEYDKNREVQYKNRKATLPKIISPDVVEICEVRDEYPDDSSPDVMGYCFNKNLDETHRYVSEHNKETNQDTMKMVLEEFPDGCDDNEREKQLDKNKKVVQRVITENKI